MPNPPHALLLDFGGVIAESEPARATPVELLARVSELARGELDPQLIDADLRAGLRAYGQWRDAVGRAYAPHELTHRQLWENFITADWPAAAQRAVAAHASELTAQLVARGEDWRLRAGVTDLLDLAAAAGIPAAVVSNTACGAPMREFLDRTGLGRRFARQVYSDEAGVRKPNPAMAWAATEALGVDPGRAWFVGDKLLRDVLCARRAGVGYVVLVHRPDRVVPEHPWLFPDVLLDDMVGVRDLFAAALA